jgi:hypothetical protein
MTTPTTDAEQTKELQVILTSLQHARDRQSRRKDRLVLANATRDEADIAQHDADNSKTNVALEAATKAKNIALAACKCTADDIKRLEAACVAQQAADDAARVAREKEAKAKNERMAKRAAEEEEAARVAAAAAAAAAAFAMPIGGMMDVIDIKSDSGGDTGAPPPLSNATETAKPVTKTRKNKETHEGACKRALDNANLPRAYMGGLSAVLKTFRTSKVTTNREMPNADVLNGLRACLANEEIVRTVLCLRDARARPNAPDGRSTLGFAGDSDVETVEEDLGPPHPTITLEKTPSATLRTDSDAKVSPASKRPKYKAHFSEPAETSDPSTVVCNLETHRAEHPEEFGKPTTTPYPSPDDTVRKAIADGDSTSKEQRDSATLALANKDTMCAGNKAPAPKSAMRSGAELSSGQLAVNARQAADEIRKESKISKCDKKGTLPEGATNFQASSVASSGREGTVTDLSLDDVIAELLVNREVHAEDVHLFTKLDNYDVMKSTLKAVTSAFSACVDEKVRVLSLIDEIETDVQKENAEFLLVTTDTAYVTKFHDARIDELRLENENARGDLRYATIRSKEMQRECEIFDAALAKIKELKRTLPEQNPVPGTLPDPAPVQPRRVLSTIVTEAEAIAGIAAHQQVEAAKKAAGKAVVENMTDV